MKKGIICVIIATALFASMEVSIKATGGAFNANQLNFLRFLIGGIVLLPFAIKKLKKAGYKLTLADLGKTALTGFICVVVSMTCFLLSVVKLSASLASLFISCNTFFGILLARLLLREKNSRNVYIALVLCFIGMLVTIINPFNLAESHIRASTSGVILGLICGITFALYGVVGKIYAKGKPIGGVVMTTFAFLFGTLELAILMALTHIPSVANFMLDAGFTSFAYVPFFKGIALSNLALLLFISIFITGVAYVCYFYAIEQLSLTFASLVFFIKPVLAPIIAIIFLSENPQINFWLGLVLIVLGSVIIFTENKKKANIYRK